MAFLSVDTAKTVLSSENRVYKTERFAKETSVFLDFNQFLSKISDSIILNISALPIGQYAADVGTAQFCFVIKQDESSRDVVFFSYISKDSFVRRGDTRFSLLLKQPTFKFEVKENRSELKEDDFLRLYRLGASDGLYFPRLDKEQGAIVNIENANVIVQGVAGSGKTNLCIDKIVFSAARGYAGRVMYSTFSRGLLADVKIKVLDYINSIRHLLVDIENKNVIFCGNNQGKAVENKLGIYLPMTGDNLVRRLCMVADFLEQKVDYFLIEDIYRANVKKEIKIADERFFVNDFLGTSKNHQLLAKLQRLEHLSYEVIYKEIFGMICGVADSGDSKKIMSKDEYVRRREDSFNREECEAIYQLAKEYFAFMKESGATDNNFMSREMLERIGSLQKYSLIILDEVQDMTQINLTFFKGLALKMFCVGDALQMINASYFSFSFLKRLLYDKDYSNVIELTNNYRSTKKIADIAQNLSQLNEKCFGVHSFVLKNRSTANDERSEVVRVCEAGFLASLAQKPFNNYTIVVAGHKERERLREYLKKQEILTVGEIKGLERDTVVLFDIISSSFAQWNAFERLKLNRKKADENSVFRYYFNLFYVGISRAKIRLYVDESRHIETFKEFLENGFEQLSKSDAVFSIVDAGERTEAEQDEIIARAREFIRLGQYENARFTAQKILAKNERAAEITRIDISQEFISRGEYREAGIRFMQFSMYDDAKRQFSLAGETALASLADACIGSGSVSALEVLSSYVDMQESEDVRKIILGLVKDDLQKLKENITMISNDLAQIKENKR